jgi:phage gpG-like protein
MSAALHTDFSQVARISRAMAQLSALDKDALLDGLGFLAENQIKTRIREEKRAPDGSPWAPLSDDYEQRKAQVSSGGLLVRHNFLHDSIQHLVLGDAVAIGSNLVQAAHLNFGGEDIGTGMPAREYLGFSPDNLADLRELAEDYLQQQLEAL